jgi:two-component system phosphate regulon response regulator PhoB/two-component system alkaline phosphatase synthesis response regulator PhoP
MSKFIAIVDDEPDITELIALHLSNAGFTPKAYNEPQQFLRSLNKRIPDLVVLDLMLPGTDGFEICKQLRKEARSASVPIIMLTAKADESDKILGLELGADDYVTKPFSPKELVARVKAVLRRKEQPEPRGTEARESITIDRAAVEVFVDGKRVPLTTTEFKILDMLMSKKGVVLSREQILDALWGDEKIVVDRTIDVHIRHLREKLGKAGNRITNVRGMGYKFERS